jgi:hypothetical protein
MLFRDEFFGIFCGQDIDGSVRIEDRRTVFPVNAGMAHGDGDRRLNRFLIKTDIRRDGEDQVCPMVFRAFEIHFYVVVILVQILPNQIARRTLIRFFPPRPELAFASAIALQEHLAGRKVECLDGIRTNTYMKKNCIFSMVSLIPPLKHDIVSHQ